MNPTHIGAALVGIAVGELAVLLAASEVARWRRQRRAGADGGSAQRSLRDEAFATRPRLAPATRVHRDGDIYWNICADTDDAAARILVWISDEM